MTITGRPSDETILHFSEMHFSGPYWRGAAPRQLRAQALMQAWSMVLRAWDEKVGSLGADRGCQEDSSAPVCRMAERPGPNDATDAAKRCGKLLLPVEVRQITYAPKSATRIAGRVHAGTKRSIFQNPRTSVILRLEFPGR